MIAKGYVLPVGHVQPFQNSKVQFRYSTTASQQAERSAAAAAAGGSGSGAGTAADGSDESETETANPLLRRHYMRTARHAKLRLELQQLRAELGAVSHDADIHDLKLAISEQRHGLQAVEYHCRAKTREQSHVCCRLYCNAQTSATSYLSATTTPPLHTQEVKETGKEIKTQIRRQRDKSLLRAAKAVDLASYQSRFAQDELKDSKDFLNSCYDQILQLERSVESSNRSFAHTLGTYGSGVLLKLLHWLLGLIFFFIIAVSNTTRFFLAQSPPLRIFSRMIVCLPPYLSACLPMMCHQPVSVSPSPPLPPSPSSCACWSSPLRPDQTS